VPLGQDAVPDYLAVSFSSTDYVGHLFGASSLESEENIARLDRTLADLSVLTEKPKGADQQQRQCHKIQEPDDPNGPPARLQQSSAGSMSTLE